MRPEQSQIAVFARRMADYNCSATVIGDRRAYINNRNSDYRRHGCDLVLGHRKILPGPATGISFEAASCAGLFRSDRGPCASDARVSVFPLAASKFID